MMADKVSQTLVVDFEEGGSSRTDNGAEIILEYDDRSTDEGGLNARKNPLFTDTANFLLYQYKVFNLDVTSSSGSVVYSSTPYIQVLEETVTFDQESKTTVSKPVNKIVSSHWVGSDGGEIAINGRFLEISNSGNFVLKVKYETIYNVVKLTPPNITDPSVESYPINLVVTAEEEL